MKMLKKICKKISGIALALIVVLYNVPVVFAAGTVALSITGPATGSVGDQLTFVVRAGTISGGNGKMYSLGGTLTYDKTILQLNSCSKISNITGGNVNKNNGIIGLYDEYYDGSDSESGASSNTDILSCKMTALANGTTTITINKPEVNALDTSKMTVTMTGKEVTIGAAGPTTTTTTTTKTTTTTTKATTTTTTTTTKKAVSNDATLQSLSASGYTLSPAFSSGNGSYTVTVPSTATTVSISATASNSKAKISNAITGTGSATGNVTLTGDSTTVTVLVTAEDGSTTKPYTITINKQAPVTPKDSDSSLKDLTIGGKTIDGFSPTKTNYTINVGENDTSINIAGIATSGKSTVSVSGGTNLKAGTNVAKVTVTAEDGSTTVYTINIVKPSTPGTTGTTKKGETTKKNTTSTTTKKKSSEKGVGTFTIGSSHTMEPEYSDKVDVYDITVPYEVESLDLSLKLKDSNAKYKVTGNENFQVGKVNVVTITITAEDGTERTIILNVTRSTDVDGTALIDIGLPGEYDVNPKFDPDNLYYTVNVDPETDTLKLNPKAPEGSTVKTYGNENLKEGWNTVLVSVTDKNGYTRTYTLNVYKEGKKILGLTPQQFAIVAGIIGGLLLTFFLILLLLARRKKKEEQVPVEQAPIIDFKPEFNFGSRNGTDDDVVYPNAEFNQDSKVQRDVKVENGDEDVIAALNPTIEHKGDTPMLQSKSSESVPYDPYDEIVTKDELIDAIEEGLSTKNPEKLKMLLEQEELNRKKEELRKKEEANK